ncbi:MAB_1171c family putative transporter [Streptomyces sp. CT34]|uniref:MAB_1171c family putative transporter n=1 Tax=Streptomyces sp. CT34 TaxID=1553907 RepID=UPI0005B88F92|nr:MAB_1171c family putative transporter [Streptomyces sp. CT34]
MSALSARHDLHCVNLLYSSVAALCWLCTLDRARRILAGHTSPASITLLCSFVFKGTAFTLNVPAVYVAFDHAVGLPDLARLIIDISNGVAWTASVLILLNLWCAEPGEGRAHVRRWTLIALGAATVMAALWLLTPGLPENPVPTYTVFDGFVGHAVYMLYFLFTLGFGLIRVAVCSLGYARLAGPPWIRCGLVLTACGALVHLSVCVLRALSIFGASLGNLTTAWQIFSPEMLSLGTSMMLLGLTIPIWGPPLSRRLNRLRAYHHYRRLGRLWGDLYSRNPAIALSPPGQAVGTAEYKLYRRLVEIQDGLVALQADLRPDGSVQSARVLLQALRARPTVPPAPAAEPAPSVGSGPDADHAAERSALLRLSRNYARLARRQQFLDRLLRGGAAT